MPIPADAPVTNAQAMLPVCHHGLVQIGLLSDTHGFLDPALFTYFETCDELWHAGDFGPVEVLEELRQFKPTRGVWGNIDGAGIRTECPQDLCWECEGVKVYMTHIGGYPGHYDRRAKGEIELFRPALFLCGHSHITKIIRDPARNLLHMNPGACGHNGWHQVRTALRFSINEGKISDVNVIELGARGKPREDAGQKR